MKRISSIIAILLTTLAAAAQLPASSDVMDVTARVADRFIARYPDVGAKSHVGGKTRNSKIWTRGVFYEGLLNAYRENPREDWLRYCTDWGEFHNWVSSSDTEAKNHNADYQCCGQAYLQMYLMDPSQTVRMEHIRMRIDNMMATGRVNFWYWVDAIQMAMPVMAMLGDITGDPAYWTRMYEMYAYTRDSQGGDKRGGGRPLFNTSTGLWYRDYKFDPPYRDLTEPDKDCYWSRGNGWVYAALVRVLEDVPANDPHRADYIADFKAMSEALLKCQRPDGFWNCSLHDPNNYGGKELTGTSLFVYGMAWGINNGILDRKKYLEPCVKAWDAMVKDAVHENGYLGYVQGTGKEPKDGQPTSYDSRPDFDDYGTGCFLLAGTEIYKLKK